MRKALVCMILPLSLLVGGAAEAGGFSVRIRAPRPRVTVSVPLGVVARPPRPPHRTVVAPVRPARGLVWRSGHYVRLGGRYSWVAGAWVRPPRGRTAWVPGAWYPRGRGGVWVAGYWR